MRAGNFWKRSIRFQWWRWKINASGQFRCWQSSLLKAAASLALIAGIAGCRQDMHNQPKYIPLRSGMFFADGRSARMQVPGTIARGELHEDTYYYTGKVNGVEGDRLPLANGAKLEDVLHRGQDRYNIYCAPCHSQMGNGNGMIVQRGYRKAGNFMDPRLMKSPLGHFFDVMTNGYGAMPEYASQIPPDDRWAIAAYIRVLQESQGTGQAMADVPKDMQDKIGNPEAQHPAAGEAGNESEQKAANQ